MSTEKDFCDYETCVALEELEFPLEEDYGGVCIKSCVYKKPSLYEAQKWLREEKDVIVYPEKSSIGWFYTTHYNIGKVHRFKYSEEYYNSYEEALSEGLREAVKILKEE